MRAAMNQLTKNKYCDQTYSEKLKLVFDNGIINFKNKNKRDVLLNFSEIIDSRTYSHTM